MKTRLCPTLRYFSFETQCNPRPDSTPGLNGLGMPRSGNFPTENQIFGLEMIDDPPGLNINTNINKKCFAGDAVLWCMPCRGKYFDKVLAKLKLH